MKNDRFEHHTNYDHNGDPSAPFYNGCPPWFVEIAEQSRRRKKGYHEVGYHLGHAALRLLSDVSGGTAARFYCNMMGYHEKVRWDRLWVDFRVTFPRLMALVPVGGKTTFMEGVKRSVIEGWNF